MTKKIFKTIVLNLLILIVSNVYSQPTVQAGISVSGTDLVISARPNDALSGNFSGGNITIVWPISYSVTLGAITNTTGSWILNGSGQSGTNDYANFAIPAGIVGINWASGSTNELFHVAVNQTGSGTGTFTLENGIPLAGDWYFEVGGGDFTNTSTPFYASSTEIPLPVELTTFTAKQTGAKIDLNWQTKTEIDNYGFEVERALVNEFKNQQSTISNPQYKKIGFVKGNGNCNSPKEYNFTDNNPVGGSKFMYRLKQVDTDGSFTYSQENEVELLPTRYQLFQNYPNPFNASTKIKFSIPEAGKTRLYIFNNLGEQVLVLLDQQFEPGTYETDFNATNLSSGVYICVFKSKNYFESRKLVLLK